MRKLSLLIALMLAIVSVKAHGNHSIKSDFLLSWATSARFFIFSINPQTYVQKYLKYSL